MKNWKKTMAVAAAVILAAMPAEVMASGWDAEAQDAMESGWEAEIQDTEGQTWEAEVRDEMTENLEAADPTDAPGLTGNDSEVESIEESADLLSADLPASCSQEEWDVLAYTNKERLSYGLQPLTTFTRLQWAAGTRAAELPTLFSHTRPDGSSCYTVLSDKGISGWWTAAENIAAGYGTPLVVVNGWMNSAGHRANILNGNLDHMGVGYYRNSSGYPYWVQLFTGGCSFSSLSIVGLEKNLVVERGTSLEDLGLACKLTCTHGNSYLPLDEAFCSGYNSKDTSGEPQTVTVNVLGVRTTFPITVKAAQAPGETTLRVTDRTTSTVSIAWDRVAGAEGYTVWYRSEYEDGVSRKVFNGGNNTSWKQTGLQPGTKYFYTVRAWTDNGTGSAHDYVFGPQSPTQRGTTKPMAAVISNVTMQNGKIRVKLAGAAKGAEMYSMCYSTNPQGFETGDFKVGIRTKYTTRTLTPTFSSGLYFISVKSYRDLGNNKKVYGEWSNTWGVTDQIIWG